MTLFANNWLVGNRAAFVYEATPDGIVRTIQQPVGTFRHYNYGMNASIPALIDNTAAVPESYTVDMVFIR